MSTRGSETTRRISIDADAAGGRLDRALADALPDLSRSRIKTLIAEGCVSMGGGKVTDVSRRVKSGEAFDVMIPDLVPAVPAGQDIPLEVVYEDDQVIVINKPAGLVVHPAPGNPDRTLVNALIAHCGASLSGVGGVARPGIVHRLDKDTSGLMVAAKTDLAHRALAEQFAAHTLERAYQAVVWGIPAKNEGTIEGNIGRHPRNRKKMTVVRRGGKHAVTHYKILRRLGTWASLVECRLETGRTHQIRVHMSSIGHPIVGDPVYGRSDRRRLHTAKTSFVNAVTALNRQALHAYLIGFEHPKTHVFLRFESDLPEELKTLL